MNKTMTKKALEKLNDKQMEYCKALSYIINRARTNGNALEAVTACNDVRRESADAAKAHRKERK